MRIALCLALLTLASIAQALTRTDVGVFTSGTGHGTGSYTTSSFSVASGELAVVAVSAISNNGSSAVPANFTLSQSGGLTVTSRLVGGTDSAWTTGTTFFSFVSTGGSMTVTADCGATDIYAYKIEVWSYSGFNATTPFAATATGSGSPYDGSRTITLSGTPAADSEVLAVVTGGGSDGTADVTPGTGWTELSDTELAGGWLFAQSQVRVGGTTSVTWNDLDANVGGGGKYAAAFAAIEVQADAGGGASGLLLRRRRD